MSWFQNNEVTTGDGFSAGLKQNSQNVNRCKNGFESFKDSKMFREVALSTANHKLQKWIKNNLHCSLQLLFEDLAATEQLTQAAKKSPTKIAKLKNFILTLNLLMWLIKGRSPK